jgi:integrase
MAERPPRLGLVRRIPVELDPPEAWTVEELDRLLLAASQRKGMVDDIPAGRWWLSLLLTIYWTSCRISALIGTHSESYKGDGVLVRKQKNHRPQWYPLPQSCCKAIDATDPKSHELLWPWPKHRRGLWQEMREIVEQAGIPAPKGHNQLFHRLRRTTISLCAMVDPEVAQRTAGHASYATTERHYIDPRIVRKRSAADVLPEPIIRRA